MAVKDSVFQKVGKMTNIDWKLLKAIAMVESSLDPEACSNAGAVGLMQITPIALEEINNRFHLGFSMEDMKDPENNVYVAALYLKWIAGVVGNWFKRTWVEMLREAPLQNWVLWAYNWGIGNVRKLYLGEKLFRDIPDETLKYVNKISKAYGEIERRDYDG